MLLKTSDHLFQDEHIQQQARNIVHNVISKVKNVSFSVNKIYI